MRKMKNSKTGKVINIVRHGITKNFWEYYITDNRFDSNTVQCLVMGFETELGDVYMPEVQPYFISQSSDLEEVMPASGWEWVD